MREEQAVPEVLVRVAPRLLRDALSLVLRQAGLRVAACPVAERRARSRAPRHFPIAVVTRDLPADAGCERLIRIDEEGSVIDDAGRPLAAPGIDGLLVEIRRALAGDGEDPLGGAGGD